MSGASDKLRDVIRQRLLIGLSDWPTLVAEAVQYAEDEQLTSGEPTSGAGGQASADDHGPSGPAADGEDIEDRVRRIVAEEWPLRHAVEASWPPVTDCDRLDAAFAELNRVGIVARQDFTCCRNCGEAEIGAELADTDEGYVFFHAQDTERAAEGGALWLRYGATSGPATPVGQRVAETLTRHGLPVDWNGDPGRAIRVPLTWQRRIGPFPVLHARTSSDEYYPDPSADLIRILIDDVTTGDEEFFIVERTSNSAYYAQSALDDRDRYIVEYRDGGPDRHWQAVTADPEAAHAALTGWAFGLDGWRAGLEWTRLELE
ncbi:DUF6891 domain-containing protein [Micromonospora echinofusca]|uniref:DUF6891 domain-containing protein n=1 Tax=Micromonospora echinofusca TaxID=47858 RepID=A0ABS3VTJ9_MICEH|nr:hypothetical protein [Micromonospora echinofusca]MBO4207877.1 hypothetical protein [Micromonospora echinofusca]